jgi:hypothetical protein
MLSAASPMWIYSRAPMENVDDAQRILYFRTKLLLLPMLLLALLLLLLFVEVLSPHRPPAPPTEYFQLNIGGYDTANLLRVNFDTTELQGFIGCVRGLKIGKYLIDLAKIAQQNIAHGKHLCRSTSL